VKKPLFQVISRYKVITTRL